MLNYAYSVNIQVRHDIEVGAYIEATVSTFMCAGKLMDFRFGLIYYVLARNSLVLCFVSKLR
jgi:hypothetical protein